MTRFSGSHYVVSWLALLLVGSSVGVVGGATVESPKPLPFDALSPEEEATAIASAVKAARLLRMVSDRYEVIGAALFTDKSFLDLPEWPRVAEVWLFDYAANQVLRAQVNVATQAVYGFETLPFQPPLTSGEIERAGQMALRSQLALDELSASGVDPASVRWTARLWTGDGPAACPTHRCALVAFVDGETFVYEPKVLIDLNRGVILAVSTVAGIHVEVEPK